MTVFITLGGASSNSGWPRTKEILEEQSQGLPENDVRKLVAENCARLFEMRV